MYVPLFLKEPPEFFGQTIIYKLRLQTWQNNACFKKLWKRGGEYMIEKLNIYKALTKSCHSSAIADYIILTGHKWDHFQILATGRSDVHCKIKETVLIKDLNPALNENVSSEKLFLY